MEPRFAKLFIFKMAHGDKVLPIERIGGMSLFAMIRARVPPIGGRCLSVKVEALIRIGGKGFHCLVLENKIANAVKNRLALVNLNSKRDMRAVPDEQIGARSDRLAGKSQDEIGRLFAFSDVACFAQALATELVPMKTHHHPIGLPAGFANPPEILFEILVVHACTQGESLAGHEPVAANVNCSFVEFARTLLPFFLGIKAQLTLDPSKLLEGLGIDREGGF